MKWSGELDDRLRGLWREGLSSYQIALAMGVGRGAVAARRAKLDLPKRTNEAGSAAAVVHRRNSRMQAAPSPDTPKPFNTGRILPGGAWSTGDNVPKAPPNMGKFKPLEGSMPKRWEDRESGECAWPVGDDAEGRTLSCCEPVAELGKHAYCVDHMVVRHPTSAYWQKRQLRLAEKRGLP